MLFHVRMDVSISHDLDPQERDKLVVTEEKNRVDTCSLRSPRDH